VVGASPSQGGLAMTRRTIASIKRNVDPKVWESGQPGMFEGPDLRDGHRYCIRFEHRSDAEKAWAATAGFCLIFEADGSWFVA